MSFLVYSYQLTPFFFIIYQCDKKINKKISKSDKKLLTYISI
nr:MAG TPA: hypothetical protein [Caudoviricetes sp.]